MRIAHLASVLGLALATTLAVSTASAQSAAPGTAPPPAPLSGKRLAMVTSGAVVAVLGLVTLFGGGIAYANAQRSNHNDDRFAGQLTGLLMMGFGGAHLAVGVPLVIAGSLPRSGSKAMALPAAIPSITAGPRSVALRWAF